VDIVRRIGPTASPEAPCQASTRCTCSVRRWLPSSSAPGSTRRRRRRDSRLRRPGRRSSANIGRTAGADRRFPESGPAPAWTGSADPRSRPCNSPPGGHSRRFMTSPSHAGAESMSRVPMGLSAKGGSPYARWPGATLRPGQPGRFRRDLRRPLEVDRAELDEIPARSTSVRSHGRFGRISTRDSSSSRSPRRTVRHHAQPRPDRPR